ncbi:uncharacterized protein TrAtP1_012211 [Trichoderma atroviride]|uniref:uncharacterized protein n=1 Tax=Hypocrea atroviridis TaxID=63577 RepID=UPI003321C55E|nr:hypothetical protein TrAtP1_012211 [Trichoderma atroviride]
MAMTASKYHHALAQSNTSVVKAAHPSIQSLLQQSYTNTDIDLFALGFGGLGH